MTFFSRLAIPGLIRYVVMLTALVYMLYLMGTPIREFIYLDRTLVLKGEFWRLFSWVFLPPPDGMLGMLGFFLYLWFTWWVGDALEASWGTVRLNLYFFIGFIGCTAAALLFGSSFGNMLLNFSLFLALATIAPDVEILVMYIFPVKMKWVALFSLLIWGFTFVTGGIAVQAAIVACLANYLIFFSRPLFNQARNKKQVEARRAKFEAAKRDVPSTMHRCETCGITEVSNPDADFRVTDDGHEFCSAHLPKS